jgi:hypothetical protein
VLGLALLMATFLGASGVGAADKTPKVDPFVGLVPKTLDLRTVRVFQENRDRIDGSSTSWLLQYQGFDFGYFQFGDADIFQPVTGPEKVEGVSVDVNTTQKATVAIWQTPKDMFVSTHIVATKQPAAEALELTGRIVRHLAAGKTIDTLAGGVVVVESFRESYDALSIMLADGTRIKSTQNPLLRSEAMTKVFTDLFDGFSDVERQPVDVGGWIWDAKFPPPNTAPADTRPLRLSEVRTVIKTADREAAKLLPAASWVTLPKSMKAGFETRVGKGGAPVACLQVKTTAVCGMGPFVSRLINNEWYLLDVATDRMTVETPTTSLSPLAVVENSTKTYTVVAVPKNVGVVKLRVRRNLRFETVTVERPRW